MGPAIVFDKSAFESLSRDDHGERLFIFKENITPVLLREIIGDLAKTEAGAVPIERLVPALAQKFCGSGGAINHDWKALCLESLAGASIPMTGQILPQGMQQVSTPSGERALYLEPTAQNNAIMRWATAQFTNQERAWAERFRAEAQAFEVESLVGRLARVNLPRASAIERIAPIVNGFLADAGNYPLILHWALDQLRPLTPMARLPAARVSTISRWERLQRPRLSQFAPYAHHCVRALLMLLSGQKVLSSRPTNRLDVEYLLYLPFCHVFVSSDRVHQQLVPMLLRSYQSFVLTAVLREDLQRSREARQGGTREQRRGFSGMFGTRPWPAPRSVLWALWEKTYPWTPGQLRRDGRSAEAHRLVVEQASELVRAANADPYELAAGTAGGPEGLESRIITHGVPGIWVVPPG